MPDVSLIGRELTLDVSDPWELTAQAGDPGLRATVVNERHAAPDGEGESILLELASPVRYRGVEYVSVVATARHTEGLIDALHAGRPCEASVYGIPPNNGPDDPLRVDWWRGGLAMNVLMTLAADSRA
jgi:hypothetical protein